MINMWKLKRNIIQQVDGGGNQGFKYENIDMKEGNPLLKLLNYSSIMNEKVFQQSNLWRIEVYFL